MQIYPKIFRSILFVKNQSQPKIKMPLMYVGYLLTINFDKTIAKNLQLQKFVVPLHCQQKRMAPKRPPVDSSLTILTTVRRYGRVLCLYSMLSGHPNRTVKSDSLSVCHDVKRRSRSSSSSWMTRAEAEASDGSDIGSVNKVRVTILVAVRVRPLSRIIN